MSRLLIIGCGGVAQVVRIAKYLQKFVLPQEQYLSVRL